MRIYLSTWLEKAQKEVLDAKAYEERLLSYWFLAVDNKQAAEGAGLPQEEAILKAGFGRQIVYYTLISGEFRQDYFDFWINGKDSELKKKKESKEPPPTAEGISRQALITTYSRNKTKRQESILKHGNNCIACGFDFNLFYGEELARGYIETHHLTPVSVLNGKSTEQVPVCPNCHRMLHRSDPTNPISVEELIEILKGRRI